MKAVIVFLLVAFAAAAIAYPLETYDDVEEALGEVMEDHRAAKFRCELREKVRKIVEVGKNALKNNVTQEEVWKEGMEKTNELIRETKNRLSEEFKEKLKPQVHRLKMKIYRYHMRILKNMYREMKKHKLHEFAERILSAINHLKENKPKYLPGNKDDEDEELDDLEDIEEDSVAEFRCNLYEAVKKIVQAAKKAKEENASHEKIWKMGEKKTDALLKKMSTKLYMEFHKKVAAIPKVMKLYKEFEKEVGKIERVKELHEEFKKKVGEIPKVQRMAKSLGRKIYRLHLFVKEEMKMLLKKEDEALELSNFAEHAFGGTEEDDLPEEESNALGGTEESNALGGTEDESDALGGTEDESDALGGTE
ncbi:predicted protein [Nematostella vectensis]|uniref:Uncharacterized protein n=1 Tax=Nematostella vectensis TaxID=45351 RepID=A7SGM0_NEMVE|nr:predicted protein [Nematostella vectensis]|eukprot:XP_001629223.1 predicted protein [Nematostella vectensis]